LINKQGFQRTIYEEKLSGRTMISGHNTCKMQPSLMAKRTVYPKQEEWQGHGPQRVADALEANNARVNANPGYYRQRQQIIEHVFGTQKRQRGFTHTLVRGKIKVMGEVGLMFIGYNLTRCITILGAQKLIKQLLESCLHIFDAYFRLISSCFKQIFFQQAFLMHRKNRNFEALTMSLIGS